MPRKKVNPEEDELADFVPEEQPEEDQEEAADSKRSGFRDFLLKPQLLRAVVDCGFEHPSEVQHRCIPQSISGNDVLCQAQSGMGKTAVFVLATLQQIDESSDDVQCIVLCHTRELAFQICNEFQRFSKHMPGVSHAAFFGGVREDLNRQQLRNQKPNVVVGTPGRILSLINSRDLKVDKVRYFILDECDKLLDNTKMRRDVQYIFTKTPKDKQVMMFSATLGESTRATAKKFMHTPLEIQVDREKLTLHGLTQFYVKLTEKEKTRKLVDLLNNLQFNQIVVFVRTVVRCRELAKILKELGHPAVDIHGDMPQEERIANYQLFKTFERKILVSTDISGRGIDIQKVNIVVNYDMTDDTDSYLHRVGRAGRFGTKGLAISFIQTDQDKKDFEPTRTGYERTKTDEEVLQDVQNHFVVKVEPLPEKVEPSLYMS